MFKLDDNSIDWAIVNEEFFPVEERMEDVTGVITQLTQRIAQIQMMEPEQREAIPRCDEFLQILNDDLEFAYQMREMYIRIEAMRKLMKEVR